MWSTIGLFIIWGAFLILTVYVLVKLFKAGKDLRQDYARVIFFAKMEEGGEGAKLEKWAKIYDKKFWAPYFGYNFW